MKRSAEKWNTTFVVGGNPNPLVILQGAGDGSFLPPATVATFPNHPGSTIAADDLDGNGAVDLIVSDNTTNPISTSINVVVNQRLPPVDHGLRLSTTRGGNAGTVTLTLFGRGIPQGSTAKLACPSQPDIIGQNAIISPNGNSLTATFHLVGSAPGQCTVVLSQPGGTTRTAAKTFAIEEGGKANIWVDILGFDQIRVGRPQTFYIAYGNSGSVDGGGVPLWVAGIPQDVTAVLGMDLAEPERPPNTESLDWEEISPFITGNSELRLPVFANKIPAGVSGVIPLRLTCPTTAEFELRTWTTAPFFQSPLRPSVSKCLERVALLAANTLADAIPIPGLRNSACKEAVASELLRLLPTFYQSWVDRNQPMTFEAISHQFGELTWRLIALIATDLRCAPQASELRSLLGRTAFRKIAPLLIDAVVFGLDAALVYADCEQDFQEENLRELRIRPVGSFDPNEKVGSIGFGPEHFLTGTTPLRYAIFFENKETATAPAQEVIVTDPLPISQLDLSTFGFGPVAFGDQLVTTPAGQTAFTTTVDLPSAQNLLVRIAGNLNTSTGLLSWKLEALDPATGLPPEDPSAGFLPPGVGGSVLFTVMPKAGLGTGTQVSNQASIVFDVNPAILTQVWTNTLDNSTPTSSVLPLPATVSSETFEVKWAGTDVGADVRDFSVYVSDNGGPFTAFQTNTSSTSGVFLGQPGHTYSFYSIALDNVGNLEPAKTLGETNTIVQADSDPPSIVAFRSPDPNAQGWNDSPVTVRFECSDPSGLAPGSPPSPIVVSTDGAHQSVTASCTDLAGNTASLTVTGINIDTKSPRILLLPQSSVLWPPNGKMETLIFGGLVTEFLSGLERNSATFKVVDEYGRVQPTGAVSVSPHGFYLFSVQLEASRRGQDHDGRRYRVIMSVEDKAGNESTADSIVTVPRDHRR